MQKDTFKSTTAPQKVQTTTKNGIDHSSTENVVKENTELTNGYSNANGHVETVTESHRERGRQRTKKEDNKVNAEFLNQIATTMQHLQRDLDRITARVRGLEGQALQALAPQTVCNTIIIGTYPISIGRITLYLFFKYSRIRDEAISRVIIYSSYLIYLVLKC